MTTDLVTRVDARTTTATTTTTTLNADTTRNTRDRSITQLAMMSFDKIFDLAQLECIFVFRPFLMQSGLSVENGFFRLKPKSGFLTQSKKSFFDSTFFE